jgi:hypothetical protein
VQAGRYLVAPLSAQCVRQGRGVLDERCWPERSCRHRSGDGVQRRYGLRLALLYVRSGLCQSHVPAGPRSRVRGAHDSSRELPLSTWRLLARESGRAVGVRPESRHLRGGAQVLRHVLRNATAARNGAGPACTVSEARFQLADPVSPYSLSVGHAISGIGGCNPGNENRTIRQKMQMPVSDFCRSSDAKPAFARASRLHLRGPMRARCSLVLVAILGCGSGESARDMTFAPLGQAGADASSGAGGAGGRVGAGGQGGAGGHGGSSATQQCSTTQAFGIDGTVVSQAWVRLAGCGGTFPPRFDEATRHDFGERCKRTGGELLVGCDGNPYCTCPVRTGAASARAAGSACRSPSDDCGTSLKCCDAQTLPGLPNPNGPPFVCVAVNSLGACPLGR